LGFTKHGFFNIDILDTISQASLLGPKSNYSFRVFSKSQKQANKKKRLQDPANAPLHALSGISMVYSTKFAEELGIKSVQQLWDHLTADEMKCTLVVANDIVNKVKDKRGALEPEKLVNTVKAFMDGWESRSIASSIDTVDSPQSLADSFREDQAR
jgi:hypothetical protein